MRATHQILSEMSRLFAEHKVPAYINSDPDLYDLEQAAVFEQSWLYVGHESQIPENGDYILSYMGEDSVIVSRDQDGRINVLLNRCIHRGNKVCLFDRGNSKRFTCSYHGWTYGSDGGLAGLPEAGAAYQDKFDKSTGLNRAKVSTYGGLIFACWDGGGLSLDDFLGDFRWYLETFFIMEELGGLQVVPGKQRHMSPINWKLMAENFVGDHYHFTVTHASFLKVAGGLDVNPLKALGLETATTSFEVTTGTEKGAVPHSIGQLLAGPQYYEEDLRQAEKVDNDAVDWVKKRKEVIDRKLRDFPIKPYGFNRFHIFPNLSMVHATSALSGRALLMWHPRGPLETEVWEWCAVERDAPDSVKKVALATIVGGQSTAGHVGPDDVENFSRISDNTASPYAMKQTFDYTMGEDHEGSKHPLLADLDVDVNDIFPGVLSYHTTEVSQRAFLGHWLDMMQNATLESSRG